jgi:tetratricopeptide (TPR) repeat protein
MGLMGGLWRGTRSYAAAWATRRAARLDLKNRHAAERWLRWAATMAPGFSRVHREAVGTRRRAEDRLGALALALDFSQRFPQAADAWVLLGEAYVDAFRPDDAIVAFERALALEERVDAAMAAGGLYDRRGDHATAGARYARAYAAGGGPDALRGNARALRAAGDDAAARQAQQLWERDTGKQWTDK